ncbi:unnamed protein product [Closterium sp. NIES-54]
MGRASADVLRPWAHLDVGKLEVQFQSQPPPASPSMPPRTPEPSAERAPHPALSSLWAIPGFAAAASAAAGAVAGAAAGVSTQLGDAWVPGGARQQLGAGNARAGGSAGGAAGGSGSDGFGGYSSGYGGGSERALGERIALSSWLEDEEMQVAVTENAEMMALGRGATLIIFDGLPLPDGRPRPGCHPDPVVVVPACEPDDAITCLEWLVFSSFGPRPVPTPPGRPPGCFYCVAVGTAAGFLLIYADSGALLLKQVRTVVEWDGEGRGEEWWGGGRGGGAGGRGRETRIEPTQESPPPPLFLFVCTHPIPFSLFPLP